MDTTKRRAPRHQTGTVIERSGTFYIRYYRDGKRITEALVTESGQPLRRDNHFKNTTCKAVRMIATAFMKPINETTERLQQNATRLLVTDYWTDVYLPWARLNLRESTCRNYQQTWTLYMEDHFKGRTLADYRPSDASGMMTTWARAGRSGKPLGRAVIGHIRSLGSGVFGHAVKTGVIDRNPWSESGVLTKFKTKEPTRAYTIDEAKAILAALASRLNAQCIFGLAFFMGLRPSEIAGLRWEDVTGSVLHVRRAAVQGIVDETKSPSSQRDLPLIEPLSSMLKAWRARCKNVTEGYVFPKASGGPLNVESLCLHVIKPLCKAAGVAWSGLYSARRGHGTVMTRLASLTAARQTLGHSSELVTAQHYALKDQIAGDAGLKVLEATYSRDAVTITVTSEK
jgi:integrase